MLRGSLPASLEYLVLAIKVVWLEFALKLVGSLNGFFLTKKKKLEKTCLCRYAVAHVKNAALLWLGKLISKPL